MKSEIHKAIASRIDSNSAHASMLLDVVDRMFALGGSVEAARATAVSDARLSDVGRREKIAETAKGLVREALKAAIPQRQAMAQVIGRRLHMKPKPLDRDNAVGELRRQELRAFIRKTPMGQRLKVASELAADDEALDALMDAPAALSGLLPDQYGHLRDVYVKRRFGDQIVQVDALEKDCTEAGAAIDICMSTLRNASGMHEVEFKALVDKTQAEIDAR